MLVKCSSSCSFKKQSHGNLGSQPNQLFQEHLSIKPITNINNIKKKWEFKCKIENGGPPTWTIYDKLRIILDWLLINGWTSRCSVPNLFTLEQVFVLKLYILSFLYT